MKQSGRAFRLARESAEILTAALLFASCGRGDLTLVTEPPDGSAEDDGVENRRCGDDEDCLVPGEDNLVCHPTLARCVECASDEDCDGDDVCDAAVLRCRDPCATDGDCTSGESARCEPTRGVCVECLADGDCHEGEIHCNTAAGRCVECRSDEDCPASDPTCEVIQGECH